MIKVHGKTILSMEFKSIIKAHDPNPWQFIHPKPNSYWQYQSPILIGNIKAQFLLATSKPNSHWQHQSPILIGNIKAQFLLATSKPNFHWHYFIKKEKAQDYQRLERKKHHGKMLPWQKRTMAIILWKKSLIAILRITFSYYKPMKYMNIICIVTSIIYTFNTHGKHSNP